MRVQKMLPAACVLTVLAFGLTAQEFEVASVKRAAGGVSEKSCLCGDAGRVAYRAVPLKWIIETAYHVQGPQVVGPDWLDGEGFDVDASLPAGASQDQIPAMLQKLLAARFQFAARMDSRRMDAYALKIGPQGSKLAPPGDGFVYSFRQDKKGIHVRQKMSMEDLTYFLTTHLDVPVVDQTGLAGTFGVSLDFAPEVSAKAEKKAASTTPELPDALQSELGLRLESGKRAVNVLVISHVNKLPSEN